jgi:hypothetical protein
VDYDEWRQNSLCALRKAGKGKGDYSDPNNWRGICLAKKSPIDYYCTLKWSGSDEKTAW